MTEDEFWQLVGELGGRVAEPAFDRLTARLAAGPVTEIVAFGERLDQVLRRLDLPELWSQQVWDSEDDRSEPAPPLNADGFLDARAAVVCAGRATYEQVLADPARFGGVWDFAAEMLLYVPVEAYESATGERWPHPLPGSDNRVEDYPAEVSPVSPVPTISEDPDAGAIRLDVSAEAYRLVDVVGTYDVQPMEGFLAEPSPRIELPPEAQLVEWPPMISERVFGVAATRVSYAVRRNGGLVGLSMNRLWVMLVLAERWDLTLLLRPFSGAVHVEATAVHSWSYEQAERAIVALAAHVVIEVARDYEAGLAKAPDLVRLREGGRGLVPFR
ncbi:DUF4240 domain-containing protein [Fodinicola acaciae]|uniref:DUF4240 domain-containing protein n=1 Tax=Fodinicola acaciae TaxID=2681555 RepID=UPI0013D6F523|nr:DUF4240 domain-containing protein [Fodinicola acaciae]